MLLTLAWATESYSQSKTVESHGPAKGTLLVIGGSAPDIFYEKFMELVGGADAPIVVIPTAKTSYSLTAEALARFKNGFIEKGFKQVTVLHTRDRDVANSKDFVKPIKKAAGVWFSGGRQWRHADSYLNTRTGFMTNVAIDQHLFARNRQFDMFEILENRPELLGIGLDEDTGIIVEGNQFTVFGNSYVAIYDGTRWSAERDTINKLPAGSRDFYLLSEGERYDMLHRQVVAE